MLKSLFREKIYTFIYSLRFRGVEFLKCKSTIICFEILLTIPVVLNGLLRTQLTYVQVVSRVSQMSRVWLRGAIFRRKFSIHLIFLPCFLSQTLVVQITVRYPYF